ncbi:MAG TPA: R3H domain-containing nucleic acid-binding protein [Thermoanaerobaculia bacterium]|jgi:spoIIIJ-associated protein
MTQRFEGRNLEEALQAASSGLGVDRWQLTYHVLLEKRGFLGGMKRVVIEADVNADAPPPQAPVAQVPVAQVPAMIEPPPRVDTPALRNPRTERQPRGTSGSGGGGGGRDRERAPRGRGRGSKGESRGGGNRGGGPRQDHREELQVGDFEKFLTDVPEQASESEQAKVVHGWIDEVLSLSRLDVVARTEENETQIHVRLYGRDASRLTDQHGEVLDAIQVLANKALVGRKVEKEIELDCEAFKDKRMEDLGQRARDAAERVRSEGREELLPAMTPIERRIVHLALRDDADVTTESRGEGFYKRVAIILRSEAAAPAESES